jgi:hypothetical protein
MSSMLVKRWPFKVLFIFGNNKKSYGAISGEYGGWGMTTVLFLAKKLRTSNDKIQQFGMNFAATRFTLKTFE